MELTQFIRGLQVVLLEKYDWAREQKERSIQRLFAAVRTSMKYSRISDDQLMMLDNFGLAGDDAFSAKLLRTEDLYRSCNFEIYDGFVNALPMKNKERSKKSKENFRKTCGRTCQIRRARLIQNILLLPIRTFPAQRGRPRPKRLFSVTSAFVSIGE